MCQTPHIHPLSLQIVARSMAKQGSGTIVNVSSQASMRALADHTAYCTSKGALDQLTRMMALESVILPVCTCPFPNDLTWLDALAGSGRWASESTP